MINRAKGWFLLWLKRMLLIMINADSREKTRAALQEEVLSKKTLQLPAEIGSTNKEHLYPLMDAFAEKHDKIKHHFATGIGFDLQYKDSQIELVNFQVIVNGMYAQDTVEIRLPRTA